MKAKLYITIKVTDRDGKVVKQFTRKAHSFLKQYNELVYAQMLAGVTGVVDTGGTPRTVASHASTLLSTGGATDDTRSIVFGRGSTAVTISNYVLETPIAEGTGANQMNYQLHSTTAPAVVGSECSFTLSRSAINNSGSSITVTECGIYCYGGGTTWKFCIVRDVLASSVAVPDGGAITATYTIKVAV